jgi:probable rRNA maturation factor
MIEVLVRDRAWSAAIPGARRLVRSAAVAACGGKTRLTVVLADDEAVSALNKGFRGHPAATNVLAFPAAPNPEHHLGDVVLAFGVCAGEAERQRKTLADHMRHLVIHGVLHLMGYDHRSDDEARRMEAIETDLLGRLGIDDPYKSQIEGEYVQQRR